jgi:hypothetical protein
VNGYEAYCHYQAVKLHFTTPTYDYFKYNGKTSVTPDAFEKRRDKYQFHKLARKMINDDEYIMFLVSNFLHKNTIWTRDLLEPEAHNNYIEWKRIYESLTYTFDKDIQTILAEGNIDDMLAANKAKGYPPIFVMMNQGIITMETIVILDRLTNCIVKWDKEYEHDFYFEKISSIIKKYAPFLQVYLPAFKKIVQKRLTSIAA